MFAQLLITVFFAWALAELLCRLVLGVSARNSLLSLIGMGAMADEDQHDADLKHLLEQRRHDLARARQRLQLASRASDVSAELAQVEDELARVEERLTDLDRHRKKNRPVSS